MKNKSIALIALLAVTAVAQAQVVGADTQPRYKEPAAPRETITYRPVENLLTFEGGMAAPGMLTVSYGRQVSRYMMIGGGMGMVFGADDFCDDDGRLTLPLFFQVRFTTPQYRFGFFADFKAGVDFLALIGNTSSREYVQALPVLTAQTGFAIKRFTVGGGICFMWNWEYNNYGYNNSSTYRANFEPCALVSVSYSIPTAKIKRLLF